MAIDANAMYRAGFGSKSTGRDVALDERNERLSVITNTAFNILGQAAIGQIKQNYRGLQEYRNASDSQTSLLNLQVDKMPASSGDYYIGENESLKGSILELKSLYDAAARKASFGIGKGRNEGKQDMARYMKQLSDMNAVLEIYKTSREKSKAMLGVLSGVTNSDEGVKTISAGSNAFEVDNTTQQSTGALGARLRWNIETGEMEVQVGGEWQTDKKTGLKTYKDKAETGTYEEYLQKQSKPVDPASGSIALENEDGTTEQRTSFYPNPEDPSGGRDIDVAQSVNPPMSREEWTKFNQENRGFISTILYKNLKFAVEADGMMADTMRGIKSDILNASYKANAISWERVSEIYYGELQSKIGGYNDDQFKDYYFGGDTFDHSSGRMSESAPAYQRLLAEDENDGYYKNGEFVEGYGPGEADWEGRLLALKGQSFVKGSFYRKEATDKIFKNFEKQYKENVDAYKTDNPEQLVPSKYTTFLGKIVEIPTTEAGKKDKALIESIAEDSPTVTVNGVEYERVNGAGYDYRAINTKEGQIVGGPEVTKEYLIRSVSPVYGRIDDGYFGVSTYKMPTVKFDPSSKQITIQQMKDTLPKGTNLNKSDEEIREAYKKYVISLGKQKNK